MRAPLPATSTTVSGEAVSTTDVVALSPPKRSWTSGMFSTSAIGTGLLSQPS
jgi:hypothetical protein